LHAVGNNTNVSLYLVCDVHFMRVIDSSRFFFFALCFLSYCSFVRYSISYIPFARDLVIKILGGIWSDNPSS
jgi:hypothetical protein